MQAGEVQRAKLSQAQQHPRRGAQPQVRPVQHRRIAGKLDSAGDSDDLRGAGERLHLSGQHRLQPRGRDGEQAQPRGAMR